MATRIGGPANVKIFVLYLMMNINYPLDFVSVNDIVMRTDYVLYLDFAEAFNELIEQELIRAETVNADGDPEYAVTPRGRLVAEQLHSDILQRLLDEALTGALRYLDFKKRGVIASARIERRADGQYDLFCELTEKKVVLLSIRMALDSMDRAVRMRNEFMSKPDTVYRSEMALLSGNLNYLFNAKGGPDGT